VTATPVSVSTTDSDGVDCFGDAGAHRRRPRMLGAPLESVCVGEDHGCGVDARRQLLCWGEGVAARVPQLLRDVNVAAVSCGAHHTCVVLVEGQQAVCFGEQSLEVPDYLTFKAVTVDGDALSPAGLGYSVQVVQEFAFTALACGRTHTCGLRPGGQVLCWGTASLANWQSPAIDATFTELSTFGDLVCGIRQVGNTIECFGVVPPGALAAPPAGTFRAVATGERHVCALRADNRHNMPSRKGSGSSLVCWGEDSHGQASPPKGAFIRVSAGAYHACAIDERFALVCWGQKEPVVGMDDARSMENRRTTGVSENLFL
jgi:alpha-tubulin suppressor-like RCC1 family protein